MISTKNRARLVGLLWLLGSIGIAFSLVYVRPRVLVPGDAAATVANLIANESLFRAGIVSNIIGQVIFMFFALALYRLFKDFNKPLASISAIALLMSSGIGAVNSLSNHAAVTLVTQADYAKTLPPDQLVTMAMTFIRMNNSGIGLLEIFTAIFLFTFGLLIVRTKCMPVVIGVLMMIGSIGFPVNSFAKILAPQYYPAAFTQFAMLGGAISALPPMLWLLIMGVKETSIVDN